MVRAYVLYLKQIGERGRISISYVSALSFAVPSSMRKMCRYRFIPHVRSPIRSFGFNLYIQ